MSSTQLDTTHRVGQAPSMAACSREWSDVDTHLLLDLARRSVQLGLEGKAPLQPLVEHYSTPLQRMQATFVTLRDRDAVIRRVGTVRPVFPLASDVCHNAYEVGSHAVGIAPEAELTVDVQVVSPLRYLSAPSLEELLCVLNAGQDGVHLQLGSCNATFTPDKWQLWPEAVDFVRALQHQAGLDPNQWQPDVQVATYQIAQLPPGKVYVSRQSAVGKPR